jgi:UDP-glucose 4-epimerase
VPARRVLITGFANFWGHRLAARLAADPAVEQVIGLDDRPPPQGVPPGVVHVEGDIRSGDLRQLLSAAAPDTIVHNALLQFADRDYSSRMVHDRNVVGTLQLLAACDGVGTLETLVVRGSAAIYGTRGGGPAFYTEEMADRSRLQTRFQRDLGDLEAYVEAFARRHPAVCCTVLRLQPVLGRTLNTPITRLLRLPVIPTPLGFDARLQLVHEDDSVEAMAAVVRRPVRGAVNVAGAGAVSLSHALRLVGRLGLPVPTPLYGTVAGRLGFTDDVVRYLRHGRGVDTRRLTEEVGYAPRPTEAVLEALAA